MLNRTILPLLRAQWLAYLLVSAVASADDLSRKQRKLLEETQIAYGATIRWGSMDDAIGYLDPKLRKEKPPTEFELNRYAQLRVSSYRERSSAALEGGLVERRVGIVEAEVGPVDLVRPGAGGFRGLGRCHHL